MFESSISLPTAIPQLSLLYLAFQQPVFSRSIKDFPGLCGQQLRKNREWNLLYFILHFFFLPHPTIKSYDPQSLGKKTWAFKLRGCWDLLPTSNCPLQRCCRGPQRHCSLHRAPQAAAVLPKLFVSSWSSHLPLVHSQPLTLAGWRGKAESKNTFI